VKLLLQLADSLVDKGHAHAPSIKQWVEEVDVTYKDFSRRMDDYRIRLEAALGARRQELASGRGDRTSVSSASDLLATNSEQDTLSTASR